MADGRPDTTELVSHPFDRGDERVEIGLGVRLQQLLESGTMFCDDLFYRRHDMLGPEVAESWQ